MKRKKLWLKILGFQKSCKHWKMVRPEVDGKLNLEILNIWSSLQLRNLEVDEDEGTFACIVLIKRETCLIVWLGSVLRDVVNTYKLLERKPAKVRQQVRWDGGCYRHRLRGDVCRRVADNWLGDCILWKKIIHLKCVYRISGKRACCELLCVCNVIVWAGYS